MVTLVGFIKPIDGEDYLMIPLKNIVNAEVEVLADRPAPRVTITYYNTEAMKNGYL